MLSEKTPLSATAEAISVSRFYTIPSFGLFIFNFAPPQLDLASKRSYWKGEDNWISLRERDSGFGLARQTWSQIPLSTSWAVWGLQHKHLVSLDSSSKWFWELVYNITLRVPYTPYCYAIIIIQAIRLLVFFYGLFLH